MRLIDGDGINLALVERGQSDKRFDLGETIRYTPSEVQQIINEDMPTVNAIVLPCQIGDHVYTVQRNTISEYQVDGFEIYGDSSVWVNWHLISGLFGIFRVDGFPARYLGFCVFATLAEAEAALRKEVSG